MKIYIVDDNEAVITWVIKSKDLKSFIKEKGKSLTMIALPTFLKSYFSKSLMFTIYSTALVFLLASF